MKNRSIYKAIASMLTTAMLFTSVNVTVFAEEVEEVTAEESAVADSASAISVGVGDVIELGNYNGENIKWECVAVTDDGPLMVSQKVICLKEYDAAGECDLHYVDGSNFPTIRYEKGSNCWQDSNLRQWLNSNDDVVNYSHIKPSYKDEKGFLRNFTSKELTMIKEVNHLVHLNSGEWAFRKGEYFDGGKNYMTLSLDFSDDTNYEDYFYKRNKDKMFLLNAEELNLLKKNCPDSLYADASYWTGSAANTGFAHEWVNTITSSGVSGSEAYDKNVGVRPAFYFDENYYTNEDYYKIDLNFWSDHKGGPIGLKIKYDMSDFFRPSRRYSDDLAKIALVLSRDAYGGKDEVFRDFKILGFDDKMMLANTESSLVYSSRPLTYFGYKKYGDYHMFVIDVRGTSGIADIWTDVGDGKDCFKIAADNIRTLLIGFKNECADYIPNDKAIFFLTGHSLGGATVNRLSAYLSEQYGKDAVHTYTFESPHTCNITPNYSYDISGLSNIEIMDKNIGNNDISLSNAHNIINEGDSVPLVPVFSGADRYGRDYYFCLDALSDELFKELTGKESIKKETNDFYKWGIFGNHKLDLDLLYVLQREAGQQDFSRKELHRAETFLAVVRCPVDVEVYLNENLIAETVDEKAYIYNYEDISNIAVVGDEKYILFAEDKEYDIRLKATGDGTMEYDLYKKSEDDGIEEVIAFKNVELEVGKIMQTSVNTSNISVSSDEITISPNEIPLPITLEVVDENGDLVSYVDTNGSETKGYKVEYISDNDKFADENIYVPASKVTVKDRKNTKPGYEFAGWSISQNSIEIEECYQPGDVFEIHEDITLYAVWIKEGGEVTPSPTPSVQPIVENISLSSKTGNISGLVTFDFAGAEPPKDVYVLSSNGKKAILTKNVTKIGYIFKGWFYKDSKTGEEKKITAIDEKILKSNPNLKVTAKWQENAYTAQFKIVKPDKKVKVVKTKGMKVGNQKVLYESKAVTLYDSKYLSCDGYELVGWTKDAGAKINPVGNYELVTDTIKLAGDTKKNNKVVLYSVWKKK